MFLLLAFIGVAIFSDVVFNQGKAIMSIIRAFKEPNK
jgi:hypothetical protein